MNKVVLNEYSELWVEKNLSVTVCIHMSFPHFPSPVCVLLWLGVASSNAEAVIALGVLAGVVVLLVMLAVPAGVCAVLVQRRRK